MGFFQVYLGVNFKTLLNEQKLAMLLNLCLVMNYLSSYLLIKKTFLTFFKQIVHKTKAKLVRKGFALLEKSSKMDSMFQKNL